MNPGLQTDDCEADATTTAYLNTNMVEVARTFVGYLSFTHLAVAYWILRAIIKCYCLPISLLVRLTFTFFYKPSMF